MLLKKNRILVLLFLACINTQVVAAPLKHKEESCKKPSGGSADLEGWLRNFFRHDFLIHKFLDGIFVPPDQPAMPASFSRNKGKKIRSITLHQQGGWGRPDSWWRNILGKITPLTSDSLINEQLLFSIGDRLVPQQLLQSEAGLNKLPFVAKANIEVQTRTDRSDMVDIHVTTRDQLPLNWALNPLGLKGSLGYDNLLGWGYNLQGQLLYQQGIGYGVAYKAPNIGGSGATGELEYRYTPQETIRRLQACRKLDDQVRYAGAARLSHTRRTKQRLLDDATQPQSVTWSFYDAGVWLGKAWGKGQEAGQWVATGGVSGQHFTKRPTVAARFNRYFHHRVLGAGSVGFVRKRYYEDQHIDGLGDPELVPYGSKFNLVAGYQFGEWFKRPYVRLDLAQGGRLPSLGHWYGSMNIGGFWHADTVEQGIVKLHLRHFTPLLRLGRQWMRQFIHLSYLEGFRRFTGELISTDAYEISPGLSDPFPGGTKRLQLELETVVFTPVQLAGCQVAPLGFMEAVRLQDARGQVRQSSFCKALGIGLRCTHPRWRLGVLQVKVSYQPLIRGVGFEIGNGIKELLEDFEIGAPEAMSFEPY